MSLRQLTENWEKNSLSEYASLSIHSRGRAIEEKQCDIRTVFQRDRDRIIHAKSFRRLMHKTQVFISPEGDHYRTRLTHTLEVSQISRTVSRALALNEDLTESIALGHDLGHTPFGHTGEDAVSSLLESGFRHNEQSIRVVKILENNGRGLNLSFEVLDGIRNHRGNGTPCTLEGQVVQICDKIAYINHDIDDAIRANLLDINDLPKQCMKILGQNTSDRIDFLIRDLIANSKDKNSIELNGEVKQALYELRQFMFDTVYSNQLHQKERDKIKSLLTQLFQYYLNNLDKLPRDYYARIREAGDDERAVCDYIAGMTDRFAMNQFRNIFIPSSWNMQ